MFYHNKPYPLHLITDDGGKEHVKGAKCDGYLIS